MIEAILEQDSLSVTTSFHFVCMVLLGEDGVPKQLDLSHTVLASGLVETIGLLMTGND